MTDYSKLSDFEINGAVSMAMRSQSANPESKYVVINDYCNNPVDAWPIIAENRIAIIPDAAAGEWVAFNEFTLYEGDWMFASDPTHHSNGKNPLRCAMECFLLMQEGK